MQRVPGFLVNFDNITEPNLFMRGIGTDIEASAANPSVGIFIDDVYISRAAGALADLWDLERVEVLRGPQSTLFGKNVVGGLVHYVTAKPTREFNSRAELTVGNYQLLGLRGAIGGPLSDRTSAKLSFSSRQHDGYAFNTETQNDMEDLDSATARGHLLFEASDSLEVLLSADFSRRRGTGRWVEITYSPRNAPFVTPDPRSGPSSGPPMGPSGDGRSDVDDGGASVRVTWEGASTTLTSLTAFRDSKVIGEENSAGTSFDFANIEPFVTPESSIPDDFFFQTKVDKARQLSQELRLQSNDSDSAFSWMAGVYYLNEKIDRDEDVTYLFPDIFWELGHRVRLGQHRRQDLRCVRPRVATTSPTSGT